MKKALVIGSLNMDMTVKVENLPKLGETIFGTDFYKSCGGKGANQAVAISKLGIKTKMIGMVGVDEDGNKLIENLNINNVESGIIQSSYTTGKAIITVDDNGDNNIIVIPGANYEIKKEDIDSKEEDIKKSDIVILQNEIPLETTEYILEKSKKFNKITVFNPAPAVKLYSKIYENTDYLIVNETEFEFIFGINVNDTDLENKIIELKNKEKINNILITLGEKGSIIFTKENEFKKFGAYKVNAIDTTAAGDSFIGAFASKIVNNYSVYEAIKYATAVSAIVVTKSGAQESIPSEKEIEEFIKYNK